MQDVLVHTAAPDDLDALAALQPASMQALGAG